MRRHETHAPILLLAEPAAAAPLVAAIAAQAPDLKLLPFSRSLDEAKLADIEVVLGWRFPPGLAARLPALRWVCAMAAGVDIARGGHVAEPDLIAAIQSGHLAGAALDVQAVEPMTVDDPLWTVPGISITPHIAAQSSPATVAAQFLAGLRALQDGQPLPNAVDRSRGY